MIFPERIMGYAVGDPVTLNDRAPTWCSGEGWRVKALDHDDAHAPLHLVSDYPGKGTPWASRNWIVDAGVSLLSVEEAKALPLAEPQDAPSENRALAGALHYFDQETNTTPASSTAERPDPGDPGSTPGLASPSSCPVCSSEAARPAPGIERVACDPRGAWVLAWAALLGSALVGWTIQVFA